MPASRRPPERSYRHVMTDTFFAISYTPLLLPLLSLLGLGPAWSGVWVDRDAVRVQMGWGVRARIPRESVCTHGRAGQRCRHWLGSSRLAGPLAGERVFCRHGPHQDRATRASLDDGRLGTPAHASAQHDASRRTGDPAQRWPVTRPNW